ncbi:hypothetical protein [Pararhizobium sp. PWRC1-1]|uniref:hypothetical protein n=1 Tax=Pararhizobium sp. PWRC1-1 TaxID=2804566 RepID=UPI003CECA82D
MRDGWLRRIFAQALPTPQLRAGATGGPRTAVRRIILIGRHPNPTSDYYFAARLAAPGMPPHQMVDIKSNDFSSLDAEGAFVILCRYASATALKWIEQERSKLAGVGLFLDDDIPGIVTGREAAIGYRLSLLLLGLMPLRRLNRHLDIVWASTPKLADRLKSANARVLPPAPPASLWNGPHPNASGHEDQLLIAYHATAIHVDEHRFLQPIIKDVLAARPHARFEVFAGKASAYLWQGMDRVVFRQQVSWSDYLAEALTRRIDIMLVPLGSSRVNDCRSATKRIDVARAGAAGIFSISEAYGSADDSGEIRLPLDATVWRNTLITLIDEPAKRRAAAQATRDIVARMSLQAQAGLGLNPS